VGSLTPVIAAAGWSYFRFMPLRAHEFDGCLERCIVFYVKGFKWLLLLSDWYISLTVDMYIVKLSQNILHSYIHKSQNYKLNIQLAVVARNIW
jgi:hypothetical protein